MTESAANNREAQEPRYGFETRAIHVGQEPDPATGEREDESVGAAVPQLAQPDPALAGAAGRVCRRENA